jgi:hypothetical protein
MRLSTFCGLHRDTEQVTKEFWKTSQLRIKCGRQRGRVTERKLKLTGGEHRLAQVLVKPEVFSIHMKGLKIRAQETARLVLWNWPRLLHLLYSTVHPPRSPPPPHLPKDKCCCRADIFECSKRIRWICHPNNIGRSLFTVLQDNSSKFKIHWFLLIFFQCNIAAIFYGMNNENLKTYLIMCF